MLLRHKLLHRKFSLPLIIVIGIFLVGFATFCLYSYFQPSPLERPLSDADQFRNPQPILPVMPQAASPSAALHIPILMYHYVEHVKDTRDTFRQKLDTYPETLDSQLKTLTQDGYTFLYASDVGEIIDGKESLPLKPVVLTFDDGYGDFYTDALPVLKKYHVKSTAYIVSGFLGKPNYMTTKQLEAVNSSGIVEIAAHTEHHIDLQHATQAKASEEIVGSKTALETLLHIPIVSFAYPGGRFNPTVIQSVEHAGFTTGVSTLPGTEVSPGNRFILFRLRSGSRTGEHLLSFLQKMDNPKPVELHRSQPE